MSINPTDGWTLRAARDWLREQLDEGAHCPCCTQYAKVYRWSLYGTAIRALALFYRLGGTTQFVHSRDLKGYGHAGQGDASRLRNWGLLEEETSRRQDGGRSGYWRVTARGEAFLHGRISVPKYLHVYNNRVLKHSGPDVGVRDVLGTRFNYDDLMAGL